MALKFNPFTQNLDYFLHNSIASYKFGGWTEGEPTDPGVGYMSFGEWPFAVFNITDSNGNYMGYNLAMIAGGLDFYNFWFFIHSKRDPKVWIGLILYDFDTILENEGEEDERIVAYAFEIWPVFFSSIWDEELDDFTFTELINNEELLLSLEVSMNFEYFGEMAFQNPGNIYIWGGDVSGVNLGGGEDKRWTLPYKTTPGDPDYPVDRQIYVNQVDKLVRIYLDGMWRTLLDFS